MGAMARARLEREGREMDKEKEDCGRIAYLANNFWQTDAYHMKLMMKLPLQFACAA